ncbi:MAG: ABC transporter permease subunit [Dehalococcoidia bacterium]|nr:ABC transporter permease subunit [Dehalococcoidia bacterium]
MLTVFSLTLRQLTGVRRQVILLLFAAAPVGMAILVRYLTDDYTNQIIGLFDLLLVAAVLPLVVAILATTALGDDVEDRTLSFILLRPVARWQIVAAKYLAVVILGLAPLVVFGVVMAGVAFAQDIGSVSNYDEVIRPILGVLTGLVVGVLAYSAVFMWLGLISSQALGLAIVYVVVWEGFAAGIFDGIRYLSIRSYSLITMSEVGGESLTAIGDVGATAIQLQFVFGGAATVMIVFLALTLIQLRNMDVP